MERWLRQMVVVGAFLAAASVAGAAGGGIGVEPGVWEFSSTLPDPTTGEMRRFTRRECVRDRLITPERVMARMKECRIWNARFQGPSAKWNMKCDTPAGPITGAGSLRSTGKSITGTLDMSYAIGSLEIPLSSPFSGRRLGACR